MPLTTLCRTSIAAALLGATVGQAGPPKRTTETTLLIQDMSFDPLTVPPPRSALRAVPESGYSVVQYTSSSGRKVADAIRAARGRIIGPMVHSALLVGGVPLAKLKALPGVRYAGPFLPSYKLSPSVRARFAPDQKLSLAVVVFRDADGTARAITKLGGQARKVRFGAKGEALVVTLPAKLLGKLAALPEVRHIEPAMIPRKRLDVAPVAVGVRTNNAPPWANFGNLDGTGQLLGVYDSGGDTGDPNTLIPDLRGRLTGDIANWSNTTMQPTWADLEYNGTPDFHGTGVLDIAIGNGGGSAGDLLTGVAPRATGIIRPMNADSNGLEPGFLNISLALEHAYAAGARVHNNSWDPATGVYPTLEGIYNEYTVQGSAALDLFAQTNPDMLIVTSAGNDGTENGGVSNIGTLSCGKNSLAVGNSGNGNPPQGNPNVVAVPQNEIAESSSRGPTPAGQLKPDVNAPGAMVAAACSQSAMAQPYDGGVLCPNDDFAPPYQNQPGFAYGEGTSFSAPVVSGTALLVRQWFANAGITPSGMLVKSVLVNGAGALYNYAPDMAQGWGRINLASSLAGTGAGNLAWYDSWHAPGGRFSFLYPGQSVNFEGMKFTQGQPLAITLTWFDYVDAGFSGALVNDLDLTLTDGTTTYAGGVPSMQSGVTIPNGPPDTLNATEKIYLAAAPAGTWTIKVTASEVSPDTPQYFAVSVMSLESQEDAAPQGKVRYLVPKPRAP